MSDGLLATLGKVYVAPREAYRSIAARPRWEAPLLLAIAVGLAFTALWITKVDPVEFMRAQMEDSGAIDRVPVEKRAEVLRTQAKWFSAFAWIGPLFFAPLMYAALAALFLFVYRFFYGAEVTFPQSMGIVAWTFAAFALVSTPLIVLVMALKGEWNMDPNSAVQASLAAVLDRATTPKPVYSLAASLDLFSAWILFLLATGYSVASRVTLAAAAWGVVVPWAAWVLGKAALSAVF
jgi:hypothetical protein